MSTIPLAPINIMFLYALQLNFEPNAMRREMAKRNRLLYISSQIANVEKSNIFRVMTPLTQDIVTTI
jgi:enamine deaminase RidA (YjgF/YER057c/UK114 family)